MKRFLSSLAILLCLGAGAALPIPPQSQQLTTNTGVALATATVNQISSNSFNVFNSIASNVVTACRFTYTGGTFSGTNGWYASADGSYPINYVYDTSFAVRSAPSMFTDDDVRNLCNQWASLYVTNIYPHINRFLNPDGTAGSALVIDMQHGCDLIDMIYEYWRRTGSLAAWTQHQTTASNVFFINTTISNHLACARLPQGGGLIGWGFETDLQAWTTNLHASLARYRACQELEYLTTAAGNHTVYYTNEMALIRTNLEIYLYDTSQYLFKTIIDDTGEETGTPGFISFHDIMGSAYLVVLGAARPEVLDAVAHRLNDYVDAGPFRNGFVRHMPNNEDIAYIQASLASGSYEYGGYWPEFTSWCAMAIRRVNPDNADRLMKRLAGRYAALRVAGTGPPEWENPNVPNLFGPADKVLAAGCGPLMYWSTNSFKR